MVIEDTVPYRFHGLERQGKYMLGALGLGAIIAMVLGLTSAVARKGRHLSQDYRMPGKRMLDDYDAETKYIDNLTR